MQEIEKGSTMSSAISKSGSLKVSLSTSLLEVAVVDDDSPSFDLFLFFRLFEVFFKKVFIWPFGSNFHKFSIPKMSPFCVESLATPSKYLISMVSFKTVLFTCVLYICLIYFISSIEPDEIKRYTRTSCF